MLTAWDKLPLYMQNRSVKKYYDLLIKRSGSFVLKRIFDLIMSVFLIIVLSPILSILFLIVRLDSAGGAIFKQQRVTKDGKIFCVLKFRTMVKDADKKGPGITTYSDSRITRCGKWMRALRLDELPQLFNILFGDLSFVGVRPESPYYVKKYTPEMYATLLLPAGVTSPASILYKNEARLLENSRNPDETYINEVLPEKMKHNFEYIKNFGFWYDIKIMINTVFAVLKK